MNIKTMTTKILSLVMVLALLIGVCAPTVMAAPGKYTAPATEENKHINYVSIGDSMANGYGFEGYEQGGKTNSKYNFHEGIGVYGEGAYPLQFEKYLEEEYGYEVNHTKLALSALLADDLLYLLGVREEEFNDEWSGYRDYDGNVSDADNKAFYQEAVTNADIITLGTGNASFGAFLVDRFVNTVGIMGAEPYVYEGLTLENGLALLKSEEAKEIVLEYYAEMVEMLNAYVGELPIDINIDACLDVMAYTVASFIVSYEMLIDTIVEMNPDVEIILVGLMNTTYGLKMTGEDFEIPFGDLMGKAFDALNAYIAGVPAVKKLTNEAYADASFYYAEQPEPKFICQVFDDLAAANWENIQGGRLKGNTVRSRNVDAYNSTLLYAIGAAMGMNLPKINVSEVFNYTLDDDEYDNYKIVAQFTEQATAYGADYMADGAVDITKYPLVQRYVSKTGDSFIQNPGANVPVVFANEINKEISISIYLAIEDAVVECVDITEIPVDGLLGIAGDIFGALGEMPAELTSNPGPRTLRSALSNWFTSSANGRAMCKIYALFKVGNGMSVHPTPEGHDEIVKSVIAAYENGHTAELETLKNILEAIEEYSDDAYRFAYDRAVEYGIIDAMVSSLDEAALAVDQAVAWAEANLCEEAAQAVVVAAEELKAIIEELKDNIYEAEYFDAEAAAQINALAKALVDNADEFVALYNEYAPVAEEVIADIYAQYDEEIANITAEVTEKLEALYEELAVAEAREASARQSRRNDDARSVAEIKAEIEQVEADFAAAIENLKALRDAQIEAAKAAINNAKAIAINLKNAVVNVVNGVEFIVNTVDAYVEALLDLKYQEIVDVTVAIFKEYAPAVATKVANWFAANQDTILDLIVASGENIIDYLEANGDKIVAFVGYVADKLGADELAPIVDKMLEEALTFDYTIDGDSNILAIGGEYYVDENDHYAKYLAEYLGINSFSLLSNGTLRVSDLLAILNADFVNDAYGNALLGEDIDAMRELYAEAIASSDLITVEFGVVDFTNFVINQLLGKIMDDYGTEIDALIGSLGLPASLPNLSAYELDWSRFGALSTVVDIDAALAQIKATLIKNGIPEYQEIDLGGYTLGIAVADYATYAIECFVYALANYAHNLDDAILAINAINPDAQIVVLGALNALQGITFEISGTEINVGEYASYLVKALDAQAFLHALALPNTTYVSIEGAELYYDAATITDLISLALDEVDGEIVIVPQINPELLTPSAAGHAYIAEQIIAAMTATCAHAYDWCYDADCNICGAIREITGHVYDDECDATCNLCDYVRVGVGHVYDDCYDAFCNICNGERVVVGHIYNNRCDATCNNCDYIRVVAGHQYDNACDEYCNVCGSERLVGAHEYTNACDADCNICGDTREVAGHQYTNACDADCNVCGETRVPAAHVYDNCVDTECNVCGNVREALEHTFGEWEITKEATTEAEGEKQRVCSACGETETETIAKLTPSTPSIPEKKPGTTTPSTEDEKKPLGAGAVVGIVAGSVAVAGTGAFAIYWFAIQKSSFAALGTAIKGAAKGAGAAFKKLGEKIANLFKKNK